MNADQLNQLAQRLQLLASDARMAKCDAQDRDLPDVYGLVEDAEDAIDEACAKLRSAALLLAPAVAA